MEIIGEVIPAPGQEKPYQMIIRAGDKVLAHRLVDSVDEGQALVNEILPKLNEFRIDPEKPDA